MAKYEKWLGAGLGWLLTGNPLGGLLGYLAGSVSSNNNTAGAEPGITDFEVNLMILAAYLIKIDGRIALEEIAFTNRFLNTHFNDKYAEKRAQILQHCLQKEYDINAACEQIRMYTSHPTRIQVVQFLLELAACDGDQNEREHFFIFKVAGYLNINDVEYRRLKNGLSVSANTTADSYYEIIGVSGTAPMTEIRTVYRKLVLKYHPDRNNNLSEAEKKKLALRLQQIKEAYEQIKQERGEK